MEAAILHFLLSVGFLLNLNKRLYRLLITFIVLNPLLFYISNLVSADALFTALSIVWFTQLLWILFRPSLKLLLIHSLTLLLALIVRYDALYYPIISLAVILIAQSSKGSKVISITCIVLLLGVYFAITSLEYKKLTGKTMLLPAVGWQIAGNALAAYEQFPEGYPKETSADRYTELQLSITRHLDTTGPILKYFHRNLDYSYLFERSSPLYTYMNAHLPKDSTTTFVKQWAGVADLYGHYGLHLIKQRPQYFLKFYLLQNLRFFYTPRREFLETYNMDKDTIMGAAVYWFELKQNKLMAINKDLQIGMANSFQVAMALINLIFIFSLIGTYILGGFSNIGNYANAVFRVVLLFWASNFCFSIFAAPIVLRHQVFPMIISCTFGGLFLSYIIEETKSKNTKDFSQEKRGNQNKMITTFNNKIN